MGFVEFYNLDFMNRGNKNNHDFGYFNINLQNYGTYPKGINNLTKNNPKFENWSLLGHSMFIGTIGGAQQYNLHLIFTPKDGKSL